MSATHERQRSSSRRPIAPHEVEHLEAFGAEVRRLRRAAGVTIGQLASRAGVSEAHVIGLQRGVRRTRQSTIARLAPCLVPEGEWPSGDGPSTDQVAAVVDRLVSLLGPALAGPKQPDEERIMRQARILARRWFDEYRATGAWPAEAMADPSWPGPK